MKIMSENWKPVEISNVNFNNLDGLVGFEELTDYQFVNNEISFKKVKNNNVVKKPNSSKLKAKKKRKSFNRFVVEDNKVPKSINEEHLLSDSSKFNLKDNQLLNEDAIPWSNIFVPQEIIPALLELGFIEPTPIQALCIPPAIKGRRDILGAAETGSGKTLAYGIPILYGIMKNLEKDMNANESTNLIDNDLEDESPISENESGCVRVVNYGLVSSNSKSGCRKFNGKLWALILTPTRELAIQVKNHLVLAAKYTGIKVAVVVGGMSAEKQLRVLNQCPHIVVATPGRLWELITSGVEYFSNLSSIRFLAVDEADRMTEVNHFPELRSLLERLNAVPELKNQRQNFVFSATLSLVHDLPERFNKKSKKHKKGNKLTPGRKLQNFIQVLGITNPKVVDITKKEVIAANLTEACIYSKIEDKDLYLYYFLQCYPGRTLIFCNNISCVRRVASLFNILNCHPLPLHANMMQRQRLKNLDRFRDNPNAVLLATDVAARGLDIPSVQHVIHYQVPKTSESYVHRSGRTARGNKQGLTLLLIEPTEVPIYKKLWQTLNRENELAEFPIDNSLIKAIRERVYLARDVEKVEFTTKKQNSQISWLERAAKDLDIIIDDDMITEKDSETTSKIKRLTNAKRNKLNLLLSRKLTPKMVPTGNEPLRKADNGHEEILAVTTAKSSINCSLKHKKRKK